VTTVDAVHKKIAFQTQVKGSLKLANLHPTHARMQALTLADRVDGVMFRAFAPLAEGLIEIAPQLQPGGRVVAMKGDLQDDELNQVGQQWQLDGVRQLLVPELDARRCAVLLTRR
jgi:16S rRNA (guanine527-N7)-methyltransferase